MLANNDDAVSEEINRVAAKLRHQKLPVYWEFSTKD